MAPRIKYIQHPTFLESDLDTRNPLLEIGEEVYVKDETGLAIKKKVGPGRWDALPFYNLDIWEDGTQITNPIGDATGSLEGKTRMEILDLMLNPYAAPAISGQTNDANGSFVANQQLEIGNTVTTPIKVNFNVSNAGNLLGATPINVTAGGVFNNEGNFANGQVVLGLDSSLTPTTVTVVSIALKATHTKGVTSPVYTYVRFDPRILWGVSQSDSIDPGDWVNLTGFQSSVTNDYEKDYNFNNIGYAWLAIPSMLGPANLTFTDVTDPNAPAGYGVTEMGQQTINNGVTSYAYHTYRSTYYLNLSSVLRVRQS